MVSLSESWLQNSQHKKGQEQAEVLLILKIWLIDSTWFSVSSQNMFAVPVLFCMWNTGWTGCLELGTHTRVQTMLWGRMWGNFIFLHNSIKDELLLKKQKGILLPHSPHQQSEHAFDGQCSHVQVHIPRTVQNWDQLRSNTQCLYVLQRLRSEVLLVAGFSLVCLRTHH